MDFTNIINALDSASLFDLYRLNTAIDQEMSNAKRINDVKKLLHVGQEIAWFDDRTNKIEKAIITKLTNAFCHVENFSDGRGWKIQYYCINLENCDIDIEVNENVGIKKSALRVGDMVSFLDQHHNVHYAQVVKLNPKTAGVVTMDNQNWRVSYNVLRKNNDLDGDLTVSALL